MGKVNTTINNILTKFSNDTLVPGLDVVRDVTIKKNTYSSHDVNTGKNSITTTDYPVKAAVQELSLHEVSLLNRGEQRLVEPNDLKITIGLISQTVPSDIDSNDIIEMDSVKYTIIRVTKRQLSAEVLVWVIIARKL